MYCIYTGILLYRVLMFYGMIHDMLCVASSVKINLFQWIFKARGSQVEHAMKLINYHHTFSLVLLVYG